MAHRTSRGRARGNMTCTINMVNRVVHRVEVLEYVCHWIDVTDCPNKKVALKQLVAQPCMK